MTKTYILAGLVAVMAWVVFDRPPTPTPAVTPPPNAVSPPASAAGAAAAVTDVTDLAALLDPPTPPADADGPGSFVTAVGFDGTMPPGFDFNGAVPPIPPAADLPMVEVAPMPRPVSSYHPSGPVGGVGYSF